jgi:hypothetical protein
LCIYGFFFFFFFFFFLVFVFASIFGKNKKQYFYVIKIILWI